MSAPRIAVTGLHRGDNPQPGAGIIRSLRRMHPSAFIAGLVYDAFESGIYMDGGPDAVFTMPYPTNGADAFLSRLREVQERAPVDILIPTLDAEIELMVHLSPEIEALGLRTLVPNRETLARRSKNRLPELAKRCGVSVPATRAIYGWPEAEGVAQEFGFPLMVKGQYYDAQMVHSERTLDGAVSKLLVQWGAPVIMQKCISGPEFNVMGLGDGSGEAFGLCCVRKTIISDKGKGQGAMTVRDRALEEFARKIIRDLKWRGPFEVEAMKDDDTGEFMLIEVNPRFPAWVDFPSTFGVNLPAALVKMLETGLAPDVPPCEPGNFFLRHYVEVHGRIEQLAEISSQGDFAKAQPTSHPDLVTT